MIVGSKFRETSGYGNIRGITVYSNRQKECQLQNSKTRQDMAVFEVLVYLRL